MSTKNRAQIEAYIGASGSGKGVSINRRLAELKPSRLIIWDPRDEYRQHATRCNTLAEVARLTQAHHKTGAFRVRYVCDGRVKLPEAFGWLCKWAFELQNLVFLAEELSDVTSGSRAPPQWRQLITQGRHHALHVLGAAQRPALIDKTFLGNCTRIRCFALRYAEDRRAMSRALDVDDDQVGQLVTTSTERKTTINYLERDFSEGYTKPGVIHLTR